MESLNEQVASFEKEFDEQSTAVQTDIRQQAQVFQKEIEAKLQALEDEFDRQLHDLQSEFSQQTKIIRDSLKAIPESFMKQPELADTTLEDTPKITGSSPAANDNPTESFPQKK